MIISGFLFGHRVSSVWDEKSARRRPRATSAQFRVIPSCFRGGGGGSRASSSSSLSPSFSPFPSSSPSSSSVSVSAFRSSRDRYIYVYICMDLLWWFQAIFPPSSRVNDHTWGTERSTRIFARITYSRFTSCMEYYRSASMRSFNDFATHDRVKAFQAAQKHRHHFCTNEKILSRNHLFTFK